MKGIATGIGSLPHKNYFQAVQAVLQYCPRAPYWPQLPQGFAKDLMICQFLHHGPIVLENKKGVWYYKLTDEPWDPPTLAGLEILAWAVVGRHEWIKGQITGPITLGLNLVDEKGKQLLFNDEAFHYLENALLDAVRVQLNGLLPASKKVLIFFDEPVLGLKAGKEALKSYAEWYRKFIQKVRNFGAIPGLHCCSDFSWQQVLPLSPSLVSFDAYRCLASFQKSREEISEFVSDGGYLAFGIVPSSPEIAVVTDEELYEKLKTLLGCLESPPDLFFVTPSCGLGTLEEGVAGEILRRTLLLAEKFS